MNVGPRALGFACRLFGDIPYAEFRAIVSHLQCGADGNIVSTLGDSASTCAPAKPWLPPFHAVLTRPPSATDTFKMLQENPTVLNAARCLNESDGFLKGMESSSFRLEVNTELCYFDVGKCIAKNDGVPLRLCAAALLRRCRATAVLQPACADTAPCVSSGPSVTSVQREHFKMGAPRSTFSRRASPASSHSTPAAPTSRD